MMIMKKHHEEIRDRARLHFKHLEAFKEFCAGRGWKEEPVKGDFERLRMRHPERLEPLFLHARDSATQHFTTYNEASRMCRAFFATRKRA